MDKASWTPVLRTGHRYGNGNGPVTEIYCSPACGRGCTRQEFDVANMKAVECANAAGTAWKPRVWENLGWHWEIGLESDDPQQSVSIHPHGDRFVCYMNGPVQFLGTGSTPREAFAESAKKLEAMLEAVQLFSIKMEAMEPR